MVGKESFLHAHSMGGRGSSRAIAAFPMHDFTEFSLSFRPILASFCIRCRPLQFASTRWRSRDGRARLPLLLLHFRPHSLLPRYNAIVPNAIFYLLFDACALCRIHITTYTFTSVWVDGYTLVMCVNCMCCLYSIFASLISLCVCEGEVEALFITYSSY